MSKLDSILVVGPTGSVGLASCRTLIAHKSNFKRIGAFDNQTSRANADKDRLFAEYKAGGMEIIDGTYEDSSAFAGFDCVILALGNHGMHLQPQIIDTAIKGGVRHFYPSEFGADLTVGSNWDQRYYKYKTMTREHLETRKKEYPALGWTYILVGRFTEWSVIKHFGVDNANASATIYGAPEKRQSLISLPDTISYTICTLLEPIIPGHEGRQYRFHGSSPTWAIIFETLERVTGRKYAVTYVDVEEAVKREAQAKATGDVELELEASHQLIQGREGTLLPEPYDNVKFPLVTPAALEEVFRGVLADPVMRKFWGL